MGDGDRAAAVARAARESVKDPDARDQLAALDVCIAAFSGRAAQAQALVAPLLERRPITDPIAARAALAGAIAAATAGRCARTGALVDRWLPAVEGLAAEAPFAPGHLLAAHALALMLAGRLGAAREAAAAGYGAALTASAAEVTGLWALCLGRIALLAGDLDEAGRRLRESAALLGAGDTIGWRPWTLACLGRLAALRGDHETAARELDRAAELRRPTAWVYAPDVELAHACALAARGEPSTARMRMLDTVDRSAKAGQLGFAVLAAHQLVRLAEPVAAARLLEPLADRVDGPLAPACLRHAVALRERDGAALADVAREFEAIGAALFAAEAAAEAVAAHREAGDALRAHAAAGRACALAAAVAGARTPALATGAREDGLTRREREIAQLAATGLSSRAIAERLTLSTRTVDNHLRRIYRKLGISRRAQLAGLLHA